MRAMDRARAREPLLTACGGGGSSVLPKAGAPATPSKTKVQVSITMHVPGAASARNGEAATASITIAQNTAGAQVTVYNAGNDTGTPLATTAANIETSTSPGSTCTASDALRQSLVQLLDFGTGRQRRLRHHDLRSSPGGRLRSPSAQTNSAGASIPALRSPPVRQPT